MVKSLQKEKVTLTPEEKLLRAILAIRARDAKDASLKAPSGTEGGNWENFFSVQRRTKMLRFAKKLLLINWKKYMSRMKKICLMY